MNEPDPKRCSICGAEFLCYAQTGKKCWCQELPPVMPLGGADCFCPKCLAVEIEKKRAQQKKGGFTLIELLVVAAIISILAGILLPALIRSKKSAERIRCAGSLHQLGLAAQMYLDDNRGEFFRYDYGPTNNGRLYWFGWMGSGTEGERDFDITRGILYSYLKSRGVELCPSMHYETGKLKLKAKGASYGYGFNLNLSSQPPINVTRIPHPEGIALFADAAQINTFQLPASINNPMLEEFYYVSSSDRTVHFRHKQTANVLFCDGHVANEKPAEGSIDSRMPEMYVGKLKVEILVP